MSRLLPVRCRLTGVMRAVRPPAFCTLNGNRLLGVIEQHDDVIIPLDGWRVIYLPIRHSAYLQMGTQRAYHGNWR